MSSFRAQANHRLYLARLVLAGWSEARDRRETPTKILAQAFESAVCEHLIMAYGWFLLEIAQPDVAPAKPPRCCAELPAPVEGRVVAGEIHEFQQLESQGWLRELLTDREVLLDNQRRRDNLAAAPPVEPELLACWADQLEVLFERMSDSLDEY